VALEGGVEEAQRGRAVRRIEGVEGPLGGTEGAPERGLVERAFEDDGAPVVDAKEALERGLGEARRQVHAAQRADLLDLGEEARRRGLGRGGGACGVGQGHGEVRSMRVMRRTSSPAMTTVMRTGGPGRAGAKWKVETEGWPS